MDDERPRVLVVDDDGMIQALLRLALEADGYTVDTVSSATEADGRVAAARPDLALVDVHLSPGDGLQFGRHLQASGDLPVMFVSADDTLEQRLQAFEFGADDYIVKPFDVQELLARVRAVLKRSGRARAELAVGDLVINLAAHTVTRSGSIIDLTNTEYRILVTLARRANTVFPKQQLLLALWGFEAFDENRVEVHIHALRRKLEMYGPRLIHTVRGAGYLLRPVTG